MVPSTIAGKQFFRPLCEHPPHFTTFALDAWDHHRVVAGRVVPHPSDDRGLGPLLDWNAFCSSDRSASDGSGVIGHRLRQAATEIGVTRMKGEEIDDRRGEVLDVFGLGLFPSFGVGLFSLCEALG